MSEAAAPAMAAPAGGLRRRRIAVGGTVVGLALLSAPLGLMLVRVPALPVLSQLPRFELRDEQGHPFGTEALQGRPYVADFIFTGCRDSCPRLTAQMAELQDSLAGDPDAVRLVSFTVDPVHDTPEKLMAYARAARALPGRWVFLTGSLGEITALLEQGYKVAMPDENTSSEGRMHDDHLVVVDGRGRVRGYYPGDAEGRRAIRSALKRLLWGE